MISLTSTTGTGLVVSGKIYFQGVTLESRQRARSGELANSQNSEGAKKPALPDSGKVKDHQQGASKSLSKAICLPKYRAREGQPV